MPQLSVHDDGVRRFIALVDECYDRKVPLYLEARVPLEALYTEGYLAFAFRRTLSRLREMQLARFSDSASAAPPKRELRMAARAHPPARPRLSSRAARSSASMSCAAGRPWNFSSSEVRLVKKPSTPAAPRALKSSAESTE